MSREYKSQHYVWKYYLKAWATGEQIFCQRQGKLFPTSVANIAQESYFYRISELSQTELEEVIKTYENVPVIPQQMVMDIINVYKIALLELKNVLSGVGANIEKNCVLDEYLNTAEEAVMGEYEKNGLKYLNALRGGDISFYSDGESFIEFNRYFMMQYIRTKKILENIEKSEIDKECKNSWYLLRHIEVENFAYTLWCARDEWEIIKLDNNTEIPFITGDQPIVNVFGVNKPVKKLMFYYPVTPKIGILIKKKVEEYRDIKDSNDVLFYNDLINHFHNSEIYSNSKNIKDFLSQKNE